MRILAIDFGTKKIGLAVSNLAETIALPYEVIDNTNRLIPSLQAIIQKEKIEKIIVGLPRYKTTASVCWKILAFIKSLARASHLPVQGIDELVTSREAKSRTKQNDRHDVAAMLILEQYLTR